MISPDFVKVFLKQYTQLTLPEFQCLYILWRNNYDIFEALINVRTPYAEVISRLILNKLPYNIGYKLVDNRGNLFHNIAEKDPCNSGEVCRNCSLKEAIPLIDAEIEKINNILRDESKVLGF